MYTQFSLVQRVHVSVIWNWFAHLLYRLWGKVVSD